MAERTPYRGRSSHQITKPSTMRCKKTTRPSFSLTATLGAALTFMLIILYPRFTQYLMHVFSPTFLPYVLLFFALLVAFASLLGVFVNKVAPLQ